MFKFTPFFGILLLAGSFFLYDITRFEYIKKTNKSTGNVLIGIQLVRKEDVQMIETQLIDNNFNFIKINENDLLHSYLV